MSEPLDGMPAESVGARRQGLFEVQPDRAFATNRTLYLTYTVLPDGTNPAALPRSPGVLLVASAKLSADDRRLEDLKVLLNAEGTGGRADSGAGRHAAHHVHDSCRRRHQLGGLAAAAAARQQHGQGAADQHRRIDPEGQSVRRPRRRASGDLRARLPRHAGRGDPSAHRHSCGRASTGRAAATRSTPSRRARTTASR